MAANYVHHGVNKPFEYSQVRQVLCRATKLAKGNTFDKNKSITVLESVQQRL